MPGHMSSMILALALAGCAGVEQPTSPDASVSFDASARDTAEGASMAIIDGSSTDSQSGPTDAGDDELGPLCRPACSATALLVCEKALTLEQCIGPCQIVGTLCPGETRSLSICVAALGPADFVCDPIRQVPVVSPMRCVKEQEQLAGCRRKSGTF